MSIVTAPAPVRFPADPTDVDWGTPLWPAWIKGFRPHQIIAVKNILRAYENGADVVILNAPTGSGKTIIAEATRRLMRVPKCLYVANTKGLQDQFMSDFGDYAKCLKGRSNYPTLNFPERFDVEVWKRATCGDCNKHKVETPDGGWEFDCGMCHTTRICPYEIAKNAALDARLAITNTSYFIAEANGPARFVTSGREHKPVPLVIVDECDTLEAILMGQVEVVVPQKWMKKLRLKPPEKKTVETSWLEWFDEQAIPALKSEVEQWAREAENVRNGSASPLNVDQIRERNYVNRLHDRIVHLRGQVACGNAVYDGYADKEVRFKPVTVSYYGPENVWQHGDKWLLMSASVIDPQEYVDSVGIEEAGLSWEVVNVPSTFPPENRPVHVRPLANMVYKEKAEEWPKMVDGIEKVLKKHPDDRVLVHTVSYDFTKYITERLRVDREVLTYLSARDRDETLERFRKTPAGVLLAPSMDRGVDLPEDDCRVVVVTKMPYLSLKDKQVERRLYGTKNGQLWYGVQTVRSLIQMTGRGVRSAQDKCDIYILDRQFLKVHKDLRRLFPEWWLDAVDWSGGGI